jgi:hypothetical protein
MEYDDDFPDFIDFNNGGILSWLNDDHNIKIIEYFPEQKITLSKNGYQLHNAGLICDKYAILMGLHYPEYDSWLMDTESLEIVKHWVTPLKMIVFLYQFQKIHFFIVQIEELVMMNFL